MISEIEKCSIKSWVRNKNSHALKLLHLKLLNMILRLLSFLPKLRRLKSRPSYWEINSSSSLKALHHQSDPPRGQHSDPPEKKSLHPRSLEALLGQHSIQPNEIMFGNNQIDLETVETPFHLAERTNLLWLHILISHPTNSWKTIWNLWTKRKPRFRSTCTCCSSTQDCCSRRANSWSIRKKEGSEESCTGPSRGLLRTLSRTKSKCWRRVWSSWTSWCKELTITGKIIYWTTQRICNNTGSRLWELRIMNYYNQTWEREVMKCSQKWHIKTADKIQKW